MDGNGKEAAFSVSCARTPSSSYLIIINDPWEIFCADHVKYVEALWEENGINDET